MQSFHRTFTLFSAVIVSGFFLGCGGPGAPVPGGGDPAAEAADAALAPEGASEEAANAPATEAAEPGASDAVPAEPAPESEPADGSAPESDS